MASRSRGGTKSQEVRRNSKPSWADNLAPQAIGTISPSQLKEACGPGSLMRFSVRFINVKMKTRRQRLHATMSFLLAVAWLEARMGRARAKWGEVVVWQEVRRKKERWPRRTS